MDQPVSSEEKLLKLIRKSSQNKEVKKPDEKNSKTQVDFLALSNKLLVFVLAGLFIYIVMDVLYIQKNKKEIEFDTIPSINPQVGSEPEESFKEEKPFSFYLGEFERRNVFQYPWEKAEPSQAGQNVQQPVAELSTLIKVSGILMGDSPQVIVEDLKTRQTFFLSPGDSVLNAKVEEIRADRVIFNINGNKTEMVP